MLKKLKNLLECFRKTKKITLYDFGQYNELWSHHREKCKKIIRITDRYIVYINHENNIDWETTKEYDELSSKEDNPKKEKALSQCAIAEHQSVEGLSESSILDFKTIIGEAIVNCLEINLEDVDLFLKQAYQYRSDRLIEKSRTWYLMYTMFILLIYLLLFFIVLVISTQTSSCEFLSKHLLFGTWGLTGAFLSVLLRSGSMLNSCVSGRIPHFLESISRLMVGFISGQIVYLGIKSGILFANLTDTNQIEYTTSFLALLAGASERFAPSIIEKIENTSSAT